ncbi:MAG: SDR family oxidoreductase [Thermoanaerobaculia bacterium]
MLRTALVTGANRGIGLEVCRQLARKGMRVLLTARDAGMGRSESEKLASRGLNVLFEELDVSRADSVEECARRLRESGEQIDVLVNNAAIYPTESILDPGERSFRDTMEINFFGALRTCRAFVPGMVQRGYGRVVNVSSGCGSFASRLRCDPAYSISKAALNALTVSLAAELTANVKVNAANPGRVQTRMGGPDATRSLEEGSDTIVWLATLPADGPTGGFFLDRKSMPW